MKVKLLGTGSIYSKSNCSSLIINKNILVDIGPGSVKMLLKEDYNIEDIDTILITHLHADHFLDISILLPNIYVLNPNYKIKIYGPKGCRKHIINLIRLLYDDFYDECIHQYFDFIELSSGLVIQTNDYTIEAQEVTHSGIDAYGFIINSKLGITGDSIFCDNIIDIYKNCDVVVADCSMVIGEQGHMGINDIEKLIKIDDSKKIIAVHHRESTKEILKQKALKNVIIGEDGYSFEIKE